MGQNSKHEARNKFKASNSNDRNGTATFGTFSHFVICACFESRILCFVLCNSSGLLFAIFLWYTFRRTAATRILGRELVRLGDITGRRVNALGWGLAAALVGTMAANAFYLTMTFYYFYAFLIVVVAAGCVSTRLGPEPEATRVTTV